MKDNLKIMVIDDDKNSLEGVGDALELNGYPNDQYLDSEEAVNKYDADKYFLVITDFKMPKLDGLGVLRAILKNNPSAIVIVMTGFVDIYNAIDVVNYGAYSFFRKPLDIKQLIETIDIIKLENEGKVKRAVDFKKLQDEYSKLKKTYEALAKLSKNKH